jgi:hypothetical protein
VPFSSVGIIGAALLASASLPRDPIRVDAVPEVDRIRLCRTTSSVLSMRLYTRLTITNLTETAVVVARDALGGGLLRTKGRGEDSGRPDLRSVSERERAFTRRKIELPLSTADFNREFVVIEPTVRSRRFSLGR